MIDSVGKFVQYIVTGRLYHKLRVALRSVALRRREGHLSGNPARKDVAVFAVQPELELVVFWKVLPIGKGPALSLYACGEEVLKFDCFGPDKGHYHISLSTPVRTAEDRLYFYEQSASEQIERALFEVKNNLHYYLQRHQRRLVRNIRVDQNLIADVCDAAGARMREFLNEVPELQDLVMSSKLTLHQERL